MFDDLKKKLYFIRLRLLQDEGIKNGKITLFDKELYERLDNIYYDGIPLSIYFKHLLDDMTSDLKYEKKCLLLTMGFNNAKLVCGNLKNLELLYGKSEAKHYWVENDGWVYDTAFSFKFKKELYYKMYKPTDVKSCSKDEYGKMKWYQDIIDTKIEDLMPGGKYREYLSSVSIVEQKALGEAIIKEDDTFLIELNRYLDKIQYAPSQHNNDYTRKRTN